MMSAVSLDTYLEVCTSLGSVVEPLFGPRGSVALIQTATGHVGISSSGMSVITESCFSHPLSKLVVNTVVKHYQVTGDGTKSFILLLQEIMIRIKSEVKSDGNIKYNDLRIELIRGITYLMQNILPSIFASLQRNPFSVCQKINTSNREYIMKSVKLLMQTFFSGKFGCSVSKHLSSLSHDFLCKSVEDWKELHSLTKYLICNFNVMCTKIYPSVEDSCILEGFVIKDDSSIKPFVNSETNVRFVIVYNNSGNANGEQALQISNSNTIYKSIECNVAYYRKILALLKIWNISFILSPNSMTEEFSALCVQQNVYLISRICDEKIQYILSCTVIVPLVDFNEPLKNENIGNAKYLQVLSLGTKRYVQLKVESLKRFHIPYHLVLCGPTEHLCNQYYTECWNSLKVINQWLSTYIHQTSCFEDKFWQHLTDVSDKILCVAPTVENASCLELEMFSVEKELFNKTSEHLTPHAEVVGVAYPAATWEICLSNILSSCCKLELKSQVKLVCSILSVALTTVIQKINCPLYLSQHLQSKLCRNLSISHNVHYWKCNLMESTNSLEPVSSKELLIYHVLQLVIQLLKIDSIVSTKPYFKK